MAWIVDARGASNFLSSFQFCFFACSSNYAQLQFYSSVFCMLLSPKLRLLYLVICFIGTSVPYNFFCVQSFFRLGSTHFYNKLLSHVCDVRTGDKDKWDLVEVSCLVWKYNTSKGNICLKLPGKWPSKFLWSFYCELYVGICVT